jgi:hypothetical protein
MKLKLAIASAVFAFTMSSQAASVVVSNVGDGLTDVLFQNGDGSLLSGGVVAIGYFPAGYTFTTTTAAVTDFITMASALAGSLSDTLGASFAGYVEAAPVVSSPATITVGNALLGRALYVFIGDASTLATSTNFALQQSGAIADDVPNDQLYTANLSGAPTPVFGTVGTFTGDAGGQGSSTYSTLQIAAIPEPSAALLGAIGALGLLRRRRN